MTFHKGNSYHYQDVYLGKADCVKVLAFPSSEDVAQDVVDAINLAHEANGAYYFSIYNEDELAGQIFLHDINYEPEAALIGYHLFHPRFRGKSIGTKALYLLKEFVRDEMQLKILTIITGSDNRASRGIAEKNGFHDLGGAREDPESLVVFQWCVE